MGKPTGSKSGQGAGRGAPVKGQKPPSGQAITAAADAIATSVRESQVLAITNAYRSKNLEALKAALSDTGKVGKLTKETLFEAYKNLNLIMRSKATLKGTKEMLINAVAEANRRDNRK